MNGGRLLWVAVLAAVYLLTLGSAHPLDVAFGVALAAVLSFGLRGRLQRMGGRQAPGPSPATRLAAAPLLLAALLAEVARGTWDVALRVLGLRPVEHPGIVLVPIGERSELGVAVSGLLIGLSPGSLLVDVDSERGMMLFHVIDARDPDAVRAQLDHFYQRYQRRVFP
ncbi:MAG TPA: Na+/H+ antiporter subunit E [Actinomycetes bacterium]|nr:Na+/H+ antiporter subunit E [Actinomycetes bacterium]